MAQSTILAAGITATTSTDVVLAAGEVAVVGMFSADPAAKLPASFTVQMKTPAADNVVASLTAAAPQVQVNGPGTFRVKRPALKAGAVPVGVFMEK